MNTFTRNEKNIIGYYQEFIFVSFYSFLLG